ncbi:MAG: hypothetical protein NT069_35550 [Planctomycetota bacterium]|nr:hypothetical protein [Planctomycetota bacterium]
MTPLISTYVAYLVITIGIMLFVSHKLRVHGLPILTDGQEQRKPLMGSWISLVLVGFNLATLGIISYTLTVQAKVESADKAIEVLSQKVGVIVMLIAGVHFVLTISFGIIRRAYYSNTEDFNA